MRLEKVLKHLAFVSFLCLFFAPVFFLSRLSAQSGQIVVLNIPVFNSFLYFFGIFIAGYIGFFMGMAVNKLRAKNVKLALVNLLPIFTAIVVFALFFVVFFELSVSFFSILALLIICFFFSYKKAFVLYEDIINFNLLVTGACISVLIIFLFLLNKAVYYPNCLIIPFFISVSGYAIVRNQSNIDKFMERGHHDKKYLPITVRRYSFLFVTTVLFVGFIAIIFRKFFGFLLQKIVAVIKILLKVFSALVEFLTNLLFSGDSGKKQTVSQIEKQDLLPKDSTSKLVSGYIIITVVSLIVIFLLIKYRSEIARWFLTVVRGILMKLKALLTNSKTVSERTNEKGRYYYDETETVTAEKLDSKFEKNISFGRWKRKLGIYRGIKNNSQKFRYGYNLALIWLNTRGAKIKPTDTPLEILEKSQKYLTDIEFLAVTNLYNKVRYKDGFVPSESDLQILTDTLKAFTKNFK